MTTNDNLATGNRAFSPLSPPLYTGGGAIVAFERIGANRQSVGKRTLSYIGKTTRLRI